MSAYPPPTQTSSIFTSEFFNATDPITRDQADDIYLKFPYAQGSQTMQNVTMQGNLDMNSKNIINAGTITANTLSTSAISSVGNITLDPSNSLTIDGTLTANGNMTCSGTITTNSSITTLSNRGTFNRFNITTTTGNAYIDIKSGTPSETAPNYDTRLLSAGGGNTNGTGNFYIQCKETYINSRLTVGSSSGPTQPLDVFGTALIRGQIDFSGNVTDTNASGSSGLYLVTTINGTIYKIQLFSN